MMDAHPVDKYSTAWRERFRLEREAAEARRRSALEACTRVARILREQFGAKRVRVFGSTVHPGEFDANSDLDVAVEGLDPARYLKALDAACRISGFSVDLVEMESAPDGLREAIEQEGLVLDEG